MGELVARAADIEEMGQAFGTAALGIGEVLAQLRQVSDHVHHAFHSHPDQAGNAVAPLTHLHGTVEQVEEAARALAVTLIDVAHSYQANDTTVARGWDQAERGDVTRSGGR